MCSCATMPGNIPLSSRLWSDTLFPQACHVCHFVYPPQLVLKHLNMLVLIR